MSFRYSSSGTFINSLLSKFLTILLSCPLLSDSQCVVSNSLELNGEVSSRQGMFVGLRLSSGSRNG
jgi:hypothetical protein